MSGVLRVTFSQAQQGASTVNSTFTTSTTPLVTYTCRAISPWVYESDPITDIPISSFNANTDLTDVTIGNGIATIGQSAFFNCSNLTGSLTIPNTVTTIADSAFYKCSNLTGSLTIPANVQTIGDNAFDSCSQLTGLTFAPSSLLTSIGGGGFYGCLLLSGPLDIPANVQTIGDNAFDSCSQLSGLTFAPSSVLTTIGVNAFSGCSLLSGPLNIPANVQTIGVRAFLNCSQLSSLTFAPSSLLTTIDTNAFVGCSQFSGTLTIPANVQTIGFNAFFNCSQLTSLTFAPSSILTSIGNGAFSGCSKIAGPLTIPSMVTSIGNRAFNYCPQLLPFTFLGSSIPTLGTSPDNIFSMNGSIKQGYAIYPSSVSASDIAQLNLNFYDVYPFSGSVAGGTTITITGSGFTGTPTVTIGGNPANSVSVNTPTRLTAVTPAGTGTVPVVVTSAGVLTTAVTQFTYSPIPTVTSISPPTGPVAGGQFVTITGTGFTGATAVTIQGNSVTSFTVGSDTSITATTRAGTVGTASVNVTTPSGGTSAPNMLYTYTGSPIVPCFSKGTKILCFNKEAREEEYKAIDTLRKGDLVKSYKHGYRKIDCIGKGTFTNGNSHPNFNMYKMKRTETNGLTEDLIVTGGHGILVDSMPWESECKIDDKYVMPVSIYDKFVKIEDTKEYTYYHFTLENSGDNNKRYGVWANGILTETPSKNQFLSDRYEEV